MTEQIKARELVNAELDFIKEVTSSKSIFSGSVSSHCALKLDKEKSEERLQLRLGYSEIRNAYENPYEFFLPPPEGYEIRAIYENRLVPSFERIVFLEGKITREHGLAGWREISNQSELPDNSPETALVLRAVLPRIISELDFNYKIVHEIMGKMIEGLNALYCNEYEANPIKESYLNTDINKREILWKSLEKAGQSSQDLEPLLHAIRIAKRFRGEGQIQALRKFVEILKQ